MSDDKLKELYAVAQEARRKADKCHEDAISGDSDGLRADAEEAEEKAFEAERAYLAALFQAMKPDTAWMEDKPNVVKGGSRSGKRIRKEDK